MFSKLKSLALLALILISQSLFSAHSKDVTDSLTLIVDNKRASTSDKLNALDKLIHYNYLSNQYDDMKSSIDKAFSLLENKDDSCLYLKYALWEAKYTYTTKARQKAKELSKTILQSSQSNQCKELEVSTLLLLAQLNFSKQDSITSHNYIDEAFKIATEINNELLIARSINMHGITHLIKDDISSALPLINKALKSFIKLKENALTGKAYSDIAYIYYQKSVYDTAQIYNKKAAPLLEKAHSYRDLVNCYNYMALIYQNTGKLDEAIEMYFKGLKIAEEFEYKQDHIIFLYNLANCYYSLEATEKATENFKRCLQLAHANNDTLSVIYSSNALGFLALDDDIGVNIDTADKYLTKSYELSLIIDFNYSLIFGATGMAALETERLNFKLAQDYLNKAYDYAKSINNPEDQININITQAELYAKQKKYRKAISLLHKTRKNALAINSLESANSIFNVLADTYEDSGDFRNALLYQKKEKNYQDSINSSSILKNLITTENNYEQAKIEKIKSLEQENEELARLSQLKRARLTTIILIISTITLLIISFLLFKLSQNRKKRNQSLREYNTFVENHRDELKDLVEELRTTSENLDVSNKTKSKLLSIIGHDLRNPFNVIQGYIQLLTEDSPDPKTRNLYYNRINVASDKLMDMVDNLLIWSQTQSDKIEINAIETNLIEILDQSISNLQGNANLKEIKLISDYNSNEKMMIKADPDMLNRVIHNLLVNAIKFTPKEGKVSLGFKINKSKLSVWIKDTGVGMSPEDAASIFKNPSDFVKSGTDGEKGTGLGLSICRDFITAHSGKIWAESEIDKGASFIFEIPIK